MKLGPSLIGAVVGGLVGVAAQIGLESSMGKDAVWFALVVGLLTGLGARVMAGDGMRHGSFVRAGLVAFIALAGIFCGSYVSSKMTLQKSQQAYDSSPTVTPSDPGEEQEEPADDPSDASADPSEDATEDLPAEPEDAATIEPEEGEPDASEPAEGEPAAEGEAETTDEAADEPTEGEPAEDETPEPATPPTPVDLKQYEPKDAPQQKLDMFHLVFVVLGTLLAYELARGGGRKEHA